MCWTLFHHDGVRRSTSRRWETPGTPPPRDHADRRTLLLHRVAGVPLEQIHSGRIRLLLPSNAVVFTGTNGRIVGNPDLIRICGTLSMWGVTRSERGWGRHAGSTIPCPASADLRNAGRPPETYLSEVSSGSLCEAFSPRVFKVFGCWPLTLPFKLRSVATVALPPSPSTVRSGHKPSALDRWARGSG
jgi:hypothetical protein